MSSCVTISTRSSTMVLVLYTVQFAMAALSGVISRVLQADERETALKMATVTRLIASDQIRHCDANSKLRRGRAANKTDGDDVAAPDVDTAGAGGDTDDDDAASPLSTVGLEHWLLSPLAREVDFSELLARY